MAGAFGALLGALFVISQMGILKSASLVATARDVFPGGGDYGAAEPWAGLRPATPTGEPVTGVAAGGPRNLVLNTGHGALGFTLAFGSAERVARLVSSQIRL